MGKKVDSSVMDAALNVIAGSTHLVFTSAEPANYGAIAGVTLISTTVASGDFTKAAGDVSGRKLTVAAKSSLTPSSNGTVTHAVLHNGTTLLACTTVTSQAVTTSQTWDSPAFDIYEINAPT
jgi:hypothetical protein